jgi:adenine-specific DNA-methyltransferase
MNLNLFNTTNLFEAATHLFKQLGITLNSNTTEPLPLKDVLKHYYKDNDTFKSVDKTYFIGIIDDSVFKVTGMFDKNYSYKEAIEQGEKTYNGLMLFALELNRQPTRTEISELTRAFNRISQKMPVALLLKYIVDKQAVFSIAISERFKYLQNWREGEKVGKIIMLRDIYTQNPHTGHIRILQDLVKPAGVNTYAQLHQHWLQVLDISILNKKFFQELSNWYFAVMDKVSFPDDVEKNKEIRNATNLIRLITRVIFIWFLKEKQLVPAYLFSKNFVASILKDFNKNKQSHNYYNAILQNLFFGTLNQKMEERDFITEKSFQGKNPQYNVTTLYRYPELFNITKEKAKALFKDVPFLNGGLFDCLDKPKEDNDKEVIRVDGFTSNIEKRAIIPDYIFFGEEKEVDLNEVYGTKNKRYTFRGLINILESYKFTVAENTPLEEEIALDPELLGKVFENLLASYNPETQTTARKETGSFYTPREIVNYMVEESLLEYLQQNVKNTCENFETRLRELISYTETPNLFNREETQAIIEAISNCKILDPACGSGAFPMGILHTMVHILQKLDPENQYWKELQRKKAIQETEQAFTIGDKEERAKRLAEINDVFENNASDYGRKLYLIENCIYGIDIQPIAIQIAKLRFFISLVIDQKVNKSKENFGIRSLPNLETKFVAANTLIGLDKPQQLAIRNLTIQQKEKELKQVRHEYFTANTRKKKIDLQKKDKQLRKKIAELLKDDKWDKKVAEQIASFDPYDQNHFANWFDPEWMFGIKEGFDIVIGNPPYIQLQKDGGKLAKAFENKGYKTFERTGDIYTLFYEKGIELLETNGILAYITSNKWMRAGYGKSTRAFFCQHNPLKLIDLGSGVFESATVDTNILIIQKTTQKPHAYRLKALDIAKEKNIDSFDAFAHRWTTLTQLSDDTWTIASDIEQRIKQKIEQKGKPLKDWDINIYRGVLTGYNEAFIIDGKKKDELIAQDPKSAEIIKPILRGRDIKRYKAEFADLWLIATHNGIKDKGIPRINVEKDYPAIYAHLKQFEPQLQKRQDKGDHWTNLRNCAYYQEFEKEKIVWPSVGATFYTLVEKKTFVLDTNYFAVFTSDSVNKYILGILNSSLIVYWINSNDTAVGDFVYRHYKYNFEQIPIPKLSESEQLPFVRLVEQILALKEQGKDTTALEAQIDLLVYKLYDLTYEEVKVIDPAFALSREEYESKALE